MLKKDLNKAFGVVLRKHREERKITQEKLSELADVDVKMIGNIERFVRNPSLNLSDSLAHGLKIPLSRLIREAEEIREKQGGANKSGHDGK
jgi:transcriptional regulator with XRE-family HTH domain